MSHSLSNFFQELSSEGKRYFLELLHQRNEQQEKKPRKKERQKQKLMKGGSIEPLDAKSSQLKKLYHELEIR
jgi:hypothetical protein